MIIYKVNNHAIRCLFYRWWITMCLLWSVIQRLDRFWIPFFVIDFWFVFASRSSRSLFGARVYPLPSRPVQVTIHIVTQIFRCFFSVGARFDRVLFVNFSEVKNFVAHCVALGRPFCWWLAFDHLELWFGFLATVGFAFVLTSSVFGSEPYFWKAAFGPGGPLKIEKWGPINKTKISLI